MVAAEAEVRTLSTEELAQKETDLREELFNLKFQHAIGKLENTARLRTIRKDIAKILTIKRDRISEEG